MAITNASRLADFGSGIGTGGAILQVDNANKEVGIGTTNPNATLTVNYAGVAGTSLFVHGDANITGTTTVTTLSATTVNATTITGDGSDLTGISAGLGTALSQTSGNPLNLIFKTPKVLPVAAGTTVRVTSDSTSGNIAFMRESEINVGSGATLTIGSGTTLVTNILSVF
tara:strand:- start:1230 stop:1739 length:510 start_codon:yes stop_codon:yes gene_type:complete